VPLAAFRVGGAAAVLPSSAVAAAAALLAVILGALGTVRTARKRLRGRGLAIAAIPLGLIGAGGQAVLGYGSHLMVSTLQQSRLAIDVLKTSDAALQDSASQWHEQLASARFRTEVSAEEFEAWLKSLLEQHGQLQNATPLKGRNAFRPEGSTILLRYTGEFTNGVAGIEVLVGMDTGQPLIEDIRVGGSSPLP
jgi:hypothetical protein